jgi:uncharacterized protein
MAAPAHNRCGNCTLCCRLPSVPELAKPVYTLCSHCKEGEGCSVYETRPLSCRRYQCLFYSNHKLADELRPDRCGVIFERLPGRPVYLALCESPESVKSPVVAEEIQKLRDAGLAVAVTSGPLSQKGLFVPEGRNPGPFMRAIEDAAREQGVR